MTRSSSFGARLRASVVEAAAQAGTARQQVDAGFQAYVRFVDDDTEGFQILDAEDQQRLIRRLLKNLDLDENTWVPREVQWFINHHKDEGVRAAQLKDDGDETRRQLIRLYALYQETCDKGGLVDFAELLLRAFELWKKNPELLGQYRRRFRHVLVDEPRRPDRCALHHGSS